MGAIRRRLGTCALICALGQAATLAAFVPRDCCAAHLGHQGSPPPALESSPEHAGHGDLSPHAAEHHGSAHHAPAQPDDECAMRGLCDGPLALLASLLPDPGLTSVATSAAPDLTRAFLARLPSPGPGGVPISPESPPPRA